MYVPHSVRSDVEAIMAPAWREKPLSRLKSGTKCEGPFLKLDIFDSGTPARYGYGKCTNDKGKLKSVSECLANPTGAPLDFSFIGLTSVQDMAFVQRKIKESKESKAEKEHSRTDREKTDGIRSSRSARTSTIRAVKLDNNQLATVGGLSRALGEVMSSPALLLCWLDLSFNKLTHVEDALLELPMLRTLHLHSNAITRLTEVIKLGQLEGLKQLTLHGNPVADKKTYRLFVVDTLPSLKRLDFSLVTEQNREKSYTWRTMNSKHLRKLDRKFNVAARQALPIGRWTPGLTNSKSERTLNKLAESSKFRLDEDSPRSEYGD